jgi:3-hydroxyisobutyrate dehydrogenase
MSTENRGRTTVTVVGLGAMGLPMARRLVGSAYDVWAVDPSTEARGRADEAAFVPSPTSAPLLAVTWC